MVAPPAPPPAQEQLPKVAQAPEPVQEPAPQLEEVIADAGVVAPVEPPPPAGDNVMKIVLVGAECAPWSKTGGLGDVMSALPKALARRGHRVMVVVPRYANYDDVWDVDCRRTFRVFGGDQMVAYFHCFKDGVDYVFVDHPCYHSWAHNIYGGDRQDIQFRNALLCKVRLVLCMDVRTDLREEKAVRINNNIPVCFTSLCVYNCACIYICRCV